MEINNLQNSHEDDRLLPTNIEKSIDMIENAASYFLNNVKYPLKYNKTEKWPLEPYFVSLYSFIESCRSFLSEGTLEIILSVCNPTERTIVYDLRVAMAFGVVVKDAVSNLETRLHIETYTDFLTYSKKSLFVNNDKPIFDSIMLDFEKGYQERARLVLRACPIMRRVLAKK